MLAGAFFGEELYARSLGEVLAEEVGSACLEGLAVLHHGFYAKGRFGTREALTSGFFTFDDGHGHELLSEGFIDIEHLAGFDPGFFCCGMGGVAFLPEEFCGAEKEACAHFPADDVGPLVDEDGEIAVALDPLGVELADDGLAGGADDEWLFEGGGRAEDTIGPGFEAGMGDDRALFGKAIHMSSLFLEVAHGNEEGEVSVFVASVLKHFV